MAESDKLLSELAMVVDFAVEDERERAKGVALCNFHGLVAAEQVKDGQARVDETTWAVDG